MVTRCDCRRFKEGPGGAVRHTKSLDLGGQRRIAIASGGDPVVAVVLGLLQTAFENGQRT